MKSKIISNKKGQITVFMIIGILLLLGIGLLYFINQGKEPGIEADIKITQEQIPTQFNPIKFYADECAYSVAVEGLKLIGQQGGYISFDDRSLNKEPFSVNLNPTESDAVNFAPEFRTAYWWYLKSANDCASNCQFASKRPDLRNSENSIEKQLERYIDANFKGCVNGFEPFVEQGFVVTEESGPKTNVVIAVDDIQVLVNYPITAKIQDAESEMSQFFVTVNLDIDKIYKLATNLTNMQIKYHYIEDHALNSIVAFSGVSEDKLPPISELQFDLGSSISWIKNDIKYKITEMLASYIPLFQVDGTYNFEQNQFDDELSQRLYDATIIPVNDREYDKLDPKFTYLNTWPIYFNLNCEGQRCKASTAHGLVSLLPIKDYKFFYDLSFPVFVEINDPFALNGFGYTFNFFLEGNIRDNSPLNSSYQELSALPLSLERSQLCDLRTSGDVTIDVKDAVTEQSIEGAQIFYKVIDESCYIGQTLSPLIEKFPVAVGGIVSAAKDGYIGKFVDFAAEPNIESSLNIELQPVYTKNLAIKKKSVKKTARGWEFFNAPEDLTDKEYAFIALKRIGSDSEQEFSSIANYYGGESPTQIEIAPGTYEVEASLILNERIVIPESRECAKVSIIGIDIPIECYTIPSIDFGEGATAGQENFPSGGLKTTLTITQDKLASSQNVEFYVLNFDIAGIPESERVIEDLDVLDQIDDYSETYRTNLQPAFS